MKFNQKGGGSFPNPFSTHITWIAGISIKTLGLFSFVSDKLSVLTDYENHTSIVNVAKNTANSTYT